MRHCKLKTVHNIIVRVRATTPGDKYVYKRVTEHDDIDLKVTAQKRDYFVRF
jgi:hypothetical protein